MIDMHSHILPGIDDGARDEEETYKLIIEAYNAGFTKVVSTSHYYLGYYEEDEEARKSFINSINNRLKEINYNIQICVGSEIFITSDIVNLLKETKASTINGTKYVLFETPFGFEPQNLKNVIISLMSNNYVPIIAHPERYNYVQKNPNMLIELLNMGVLLQSNYGSVIGQYGKQAQKTARLLIKNHFIQLLGTDVHRKNTIYTAIPDAMKNLKELISEEELEELTTVNPNLVLENKDINKRRPTSIKKGFFGF